MLKAGETPIAIEFKSNIPTELLGKEGVINLVSSGHEANEEPTQSHKFIQRQEVTVTKSLDLLESNTDELEGPVSAGQIAVACALAYRDFRFSEIEWRSDRPKLSGVILLTDEALISRSLKTSLFGSK